jgi:hypothetical protein
MRDVRFAGLLGPGAGGGVGGGEDVGGGFGVAGEGEGGLASVFLGKKEGGLMWNI